MSSRRPKRSSSALAPPTPSRSTRGSRSKYEEPDGDDVAEDVKMGASQPDEGGDDISESGAEDEEDANGNSDLTPEPGPPRRSRSGATRGRGQQKGGKNVVTLKRKRDMTATGTDGEDEAPKSARRVRKSVSYREVPVDEALEAEADEEDEARADEVAAEDDDDDGEGEEGEEDAEGEEDEDAGASSTPRRRKNKPVDLRERVGSGRGGFSVLGAASAAARARWAKHRAEKAARGEDDDDGPRRRRTTARRDQTSSSKAAIETYTPGSKLEVKGTEYVIGDDEVELPDDDKGETKVDKEGRLLGGREYRLVTFGCPTRRNPEKQYALTIDAARACGYSDSLAFLRRCPTVLKLACNAEERQMLIDIGRVTGNLKHRTITMVSMRNVFKLMGARVVKGGKWVTDDYYEDDCLAKCAENGFTPYTPAEDDDILANAMANMAPQGRGPAGGAGDRQLAGLGNVPEGAHRAHINLAPFYTIGGPTTTFAGSGEDPWANAGWGNKRMKLKSMGVSNEDWMWRLAKETRDVDAQLREYREERLPALEGKDLDVWAWKGWNNDQKEEETEEEAGRTNGDVDMNGDADGKDAFGAVVKTDPARNGNTPPAQSADSPTGASLVPPPMDRRKSALSHEIKFPASPPTAGTPEPALPGSAVDSPLTEPSRPVRAVSALEGVDIPAPQQTHEEVEKTPGGKIVIEDAKLRGIKRKAFNGGVGSWTAGTVRAIIEADSTRSYIAQTNLMGSRAVGFASVEYCFDITASLPKDTTNDGGNDWSVHDRLRMIKEAEEWEAAERRKLQSQQVEVDAAI